jgi:hypothetical protein
MDDFESGAIRLDGPFFAMRGSEAWPGRQKRPPVRTSRTISSSTMAPIAE